MADKPVVQDRLGRAQALVDSGRRYLTTTLADLWPEVQAGHAPTMADRGALWLAATHAAHSALEAIELLYTARGRAACIATSALDRCLRDARTAVQHIGTQEVNFELAGRHLLGRDTVAEPLDDRLPRRGLRSVADRAVGADPEVVEHGRRFGRRHGPLGEQDAGEAPRTIGAPRRARTAVPSEAAGDG